MPFVLADFEKDFSASPLVSPYSTELATAVVADSFRRAGVPAPPSTFWESVGSTHAARFAEQLGILAHLLASTRLGVATVEAIRTLAPGDAEARLAAFFDEIDPLTAEMVRGNVFRREELVRKWLAAWQGVIAGETPEMSANRVRTLDYRATLAEYAKAETARKAEAAERARILREAEEREAAARGWRE